MGADTEDAGQQPFRAAGCLVYKNQGLSVCPPPEGGRSACGIVGIVNATTGDLDIETAEFGANLPRMLPDPGTPSRQEIPRA